MLFGDVLLQVVIMEYLGLYKQTLEGSCSSSESSESVLTNSGNFGAFLGFCYTFLFIVLVYQQTLVFLGLFGAVLRQTSLPSFFHARKSIHPVSLPHFSYVLPYHCIQIAL